MTIDQLDGLKDWISARITELIAKSAGQDTCKESHTRRQLENELDALFDEPVERDARTGRLL